MNFLKIYINNIYFDIKKIDTLFKFFSTKKANVKENHFLSKLKIHNDIIDKIIEICRKTKNLHYDLTFGRNNMTLKQYKTDYYYYDIYHKIYSIIHSLNKNNITSSKIYSLINQFMKKRKTKTIKINIK